MIGRLTGVLAAKNPPELLIDVGGVGYELDAPMSTFYSLPVVGERVSLHVQMIVRDDAHLLFGFATAGERALFRALLKVNGVGARVALAILSGMTVDEFGQCIQRKDVAALTRLPGIGRKTAERLLVEMQDKLSGVAAKVGALTANTVARSGTISQSPRAQAIEALMALGYKATDATRLTDATGLELDQPVEEWIRAALKNVNPR